MHYQLQSIFCKWRRPCYIVSVGKPKQLLNKKELKKGLDEVYQCAEPTLILFPDGVHLLKPLTFIILQRCPDAGFMSWEIVLSSWISAIMICREIRY